MMAEHKHCAQILRKQKERTVARNARKAPLLAARLATTTNANCCCSVPQMGTSRDRLVSIAGPRIICVVSRAPRLGDGTSYYTQCRSPQNRRLQPVYIVFGP